jgi:hypothetical protein
LHYSVSYLPFYTRSFVRRDANFSPVHFGVGYFPSRPLFFVGMGLSRLFAFGPKSGGGKNFKNLTGWTPGLSLLRFLNLSGLIVGTLRNHLKSDRIVAGGRVRPGAGGELGRDGQLAGVLASSYTWLNRVQNLLDDRHKEFDGQFGVTSTEMQRAVYLEFLYRF